VSEQSEVLSAIGDIAIGDDNRASLHVHIVLGLSDGSTRGGHLLKGTVHPTLEVVLTATPAMLRRRDSGNRADLTRFRAFSSLERYPFGLNRGGIPESRIE
jgi:uncharacterized protein